MILSLPLSTAVLRPFLGKLEQDFEQMKLQQLKALCRRCGLRVTGKREVLIQQLQQFVRLQKEKEQEIERPQKNHIEVDEVTLLANPFDEKTFEPSMNKIQNCPEDANHSSHNHSDDTLNGMYRQISPYNHSATIAISISILIQV